MHIRRHAVGRCYQVLKDLIPHYVAARRYSMLDLVTDAGVQTYADRNLPRTAKAQPIALRGELEPFLDFGSMRMCWKFVAEFIGNCSKGTFIIQDPALTRAFPDYASAV